MIQRRTLLTTSAVALGASALGGCTTPPANPAASKADQKMKESKPIVQLSGGRTLYGRSNTASESAQAGKPVIIALHGGSYTSAYFDIPGYSLLQAADRAGIPLIAIDRPAYGQSTPLAPLDSTIARNAEVLTEAIGKIWDERKHSATGIFIIGHSIGGAITVTIAAGKPSWLQGIAVSGVGLSVTPGSPARWAALPEGLVTLPTAMKDQIMFGPPGTFGPDMPQASHPSNTTCPRAELIDITTIWPTVVRGLTAKVAVPVHYRQAEFDKLWVVNEEQVRAFGASFTSSPAVDARLTLKAGHCIDFHTVAGQFHQEQLGFGMRAASRRT